MGHEFLLLHARNDDERTFVVSLVHFNTTLENVQLFFTGKIYNRYDANIFNVYCIAVVVFHFKTVPTFSFVVCRNGTESECKRILFNSREKKNRLSSTQLT